jgi:hypothetical protein
MGDELYIPVKFTAFFFHFPYFPHSSIYIGINLKIVSLSFQPICAMAKYLR